MQYTKIAAASVVKANTLFSTLGLVAKASFPPINPPTTATAAWGKAQDQSMPLSTMCPKNPMAAVAPTMTDAVPTAIFIGIRQAVTIKGIRKEPPETPTIPAKKPVARERGVGVVAMRPMTSGNLDKIIETIDPALLDACDWPRAALSFVLSHQSVATAIVGMRTVEEVEKNAATAENPIPFDIEGLYSRQHTGKKR